VTEEPAVALALVDEHVVLARDVERAIGLDRGEDVLDRVELVQGAQVHVVARVHDERRPLRQRIDARDALLERPDHIGVRWLVEPDVTVADLHEAERPRCARGAHITQRTRGEAAASERPHDAGPGPRHALQEALAVDAVAHLTITVPCMNGWIEQMYLMDPFLRTVWV
jgi:hypothetical protein